jgi:hypothetical protein
MFSELIPGLRDLRSGFITGALMLGTLYVFFADEIDQYVRPRPSVRQILDLSSWMPILLVGLLCYLAGSLYVTGLEGIVDWIHRKRVLRETRARFFLFRPILIAISPLSEASRRRIVIEAGLFYDKHPAASTVLTGSDHPIGT